MLNPLAPDLSLPLGPCIWDLRVLRCRLARTLAVIVSSAVHSSFLLSVSHASRGLARSKSSAKLEYARELNMRTVVGYLEHKRICGMVDVQTYVRTIKLFHHTC